MERRAPHAWKEYKLLRDGQPTSTKRLLGARQSPCGEQRWRSVLTLTSASAGLQNLGDCVCVVTPPLFPSAWHIVGAQEIFIVSVTYISNFSWHKNESRVDRKSSGGRGITAGGNDSGREGWIG